MEVDTILHCPVGSVSSGIPSVVTPSGDRVANIDTEHFEKDGSDVARGTKRNPRRWVVKKHVPYVDEVSYDSDSWVRCCKEESWLSSVELIWMNYERLDPLGKGTQAAVMAQPFGDATRINYLVYLGSHALEAELIWTSRRSEELDFT